MHSFPALRGAFLAAFATCVLAAQAAAAPEAAEALARARALIEKKDASAAFTLLAPLEGRHAGDAEFDYWLGVAALESDRLERAALAFERVLVRNPEFDSARLELARTYLRMGALDVAAQEFTRLLARAPSAEGRRLLEDYLAEIERLKARRERSLTAYAELGGGRDNNISSSPEDFTQAINSSFGFSGIEPTGNSVRRSDNFAAANVGVELFERLGEDRAFFGAASLRWRGYREFVDYNHTLLDAAAGYQWRRATHSYTALAFAQSFRQDGAPVDTLSAEQLTNDRDALGVSLEVRRDLGANAQLALVPQLASYRYRTNPGQDTRQLTMGLLLEQRSPAWPGILLAAKVFYSYDDARRPLNEFTQTTASRHATGIKVAAQSDSRERLSWQLAAGWSRRIDDDPYARASLVAIGRDDLYELYVKVNWRLTRELSVFPFAIAVVNDSTIDLYSFRKAEGGVGLRYDFR